MAGKYGDADGYDLYMGGWSAALSPPFIAFAGGTAGNDVLDVGCGTGNLLAALTAAHPGTRLTGVDPSAALLAKARARAELNGSTLVAGSVEALPFADGRFSHVLSMLVLQEFTDRGRALGEMRRVTRAGGVVAGCQWNFARMPVIAAVVDAIDAVDAESGAGARRNWMPAFKDEAELSQCWTAAGLEEVSASHIAVTRDFANFDAVWQPLMGGSTPSTLTLASLPPERRARARELVKRSLGVCDEAAALAITAEALVVRGVA
jgi:ubiquinone/menaquinone biosynthesis C-methylase UbiE